MLKNLDIRYAYGKSSLGRLNTVHVDLQTIFIEVANFYNTSILCGERDMIEQNKAVSEGKSFASYPQSNHNVKLPERPIAIALDAGPYIKEIRNVPWFKKQAYGMTTRELNTSRKLIGLWYEFAGCVKTIALQKKISVRWGGNFKNIFDAPHWELYGAKYNNV
jgi:hypothetical protein